MANYSKLKKSELIEICNRFDAEGVLRSDLSGYTTAEIIAEASNRDASSTVEGADDDALIMELYGRSALDAAIREADVEDVLREALNILTNKLTEADDDTLDELTEALGIADERGDLAERAIERGVSLSVFFTPNNALEFERQLCDVLGLGYHAGAAAIISKISDILKHPTIC